VADRLTARENLSFFAAMNNLFDAEAGRRLEELTDLMGMGAYIDSQVRTLSTGQVHRLGLARAMIHRPSVLLLDEPTRSLDPIAAAEFRRFLKERSWSNATALPSCSLPILWRKSGNWRTASSCADKGRMLGCDSPRGLRAATARPRSKRRWSG
jgi:ABC-type transport system involved in cytochrome c biogenesis ATPase subunit